MQVNNKRTAEIDARRQKKPKAKSEGSGNEDENNIDAELIQAQEFADAQEEANAAAAAAASSYIENENEGPGSGSNIAIENAPQRAAQQILHQNSDKPLAGSEEWHRIRKDNHKEVERRRRENINSGIKELAALLPTPETNKSQILSRAVEYIKRLKENEENNNEKWTLEKLLNDQTLSELSGANEKLKAELERAYREVEHWKKACSSRDEEK